MSAYTTPTYEILALRFGTHGDRLRRENFLVHRHSTPDARMPMDFYVWVVRNDRHVLLVDTGFPEEMAVRRGRTVVHSPPERLADLGIAASEVHEVLITHMHYDHAGNLDRFPAARVHMQEDELRFCTGPAMRHEVVRRPFERVNVTTAVQRLFEGQLVLYRGEAQILPGVSVHLVRGHTPGTQVVRVNTKRGWVVLASDAAHLWANIRGRSPFPILDNVTATLDAYETVESLADGEDHIIPGHDPEVALRFPRSAQAPDWVCLHEPALVANLNGAAS